MNVYPYMHCSLQVTKYTWRINLGETEKFWSEWFQGLSSKFLSSAPAKMLLLAGIDRLDTDLTVGQMQGNTYPEHYVLRNSLTDASKPHYGSDFAVL